MIKLVKREYILSIPTNMHGDVNYVTLMAYNAGDAISDFERKYPTLQRDYITSNLQDLTEIEDNDKEIY